MPPGSQPPAEIVDLTDSPGLQVWVALQGAALGAAIPVLLLVVAGSVATPVPIRTVLMILALAGALAGAQRGWTVRVVVDRDGITSRNLLLTQRVRWDELTGIEDDALARYWLATSPVLRAGGRRIPLRAMDLGPPWGGLTERCGDLARRLVAWAWTYNVAVDAPAYLRKGGADLDPDR